MTVAAMITAWVGRLGSAIARRRSLWLVMVLVFPFAYHAAMLLALIVRFGALPNYYELYDWPGNVAMIIASTPSVSDVLAIVQDEWLLEVGRMNYDFGNGISEWSMSVHPAKVLVVVLAGLLLATNLILLLPAGHGCSLQDASGAGAASGIGAGLVGLSSLTMSWVVCCATPSWIVGLAMLGMSVSTATWLESFGPWLNAIGFALLLAALAWQAGRLREPGPEPVRSATGSRRSEQCPSPQIG